MTPPPARTSERYAFGIRLAFAALTLFAAAQNLPAQNLPAQNLPAQNLPQNQANNSLFFRADKAALSVPSELPDSPALPELPLGGPPTVSPPHEPVAETKTPIPPRGEKSESGDSSQKNRSGAASLLRTCANLALVLAVIFGLFYITKRFAPKPKESLPKEALETLGELPFTAKIRLRLVRFGPKLLLLAVSGDRVETVSELTDPTEIAALIERCPIRSRKTGAAGVGPASNGTGGKR